VCSAKLQHSGAAHEQFLDLEDDGRVGEALGLLNQVERADDLGLDSDERAELAEVAELLGRLVVAEPERLLEKLALVVYDARRGENVKVALGRRRLEERKRRISGRLG
jgi:hypothetical protein